MSYQNFSVPGGDDTTGTGSGPGLRDPDDQIQKLDSAYESPLGRASEAVPSGPGMRKGQGGNSSPPQHLEDAYNLDNAETLRATSTDMLEHEQKDIQHCSTLSTVRTYMELEPEAPILEGHDVHHHLTLSSVRVIIREPFAEFFGVFIMILFGNGSVTQVLLSHGRDGRARRKRFRTVSEYKLGLGSRSHAWHLCRR